ncbi:7475_t:CDS:1, partial [Entrophospora sp. SA101]
KNNNFKYLYLPINYHTFTNNNNNDDDDNVLNELKNCVKIIETSKPIKALDLI